jgi:ATP phosphoribosyltransferase
MKLAIPNKGRLHDPTVDLLERAGLHLEDAADRQLHADTVDDDVGILYARAADIPEYVAEGAADAGVTGLDQVRESGEDLEDLLDLGYGSCRIVLAAPEDGGIASVEDLDGQRVATEFPRIAKRYFAEHGVDPEVVEVTGATELTPNAGMAEAIVDITSTGTTLEVNRLGVVDEILESSVRLFARPEAGDEPKVRELVTALQSVLAAEDKRYLMMNVPGDALEDVKQAMPGLGGPTVMEVEDGDGMLAVHAVVDETAIYETINAVKQEGARDVLVVPIERMMR